MQYLLLIYEDEKVGAAMSEAEQGELFMGYKTFTDDIKKSGHHKAGEALQPIATATSVRVRDGKTLTTDGPFAETREQLGGFYLVEAKDLDEALAIAARIPSAKTGTIEVRPIMPFDM
ncbi:MAG: YciI family protein [Polyangiaceae bacterium]|nr:YciI family protein [Polyangiaceae bacterium]